MFSFLFLGIIHHTRYNIHITDSSMCLNLGEFKLSMNHWKVVLFIFFFSSSQILNYWWVRVNRNCFISSLIRKILFHNHFIYTMILYHNHFIYTIYMYISSAYWIIEFCWIKLESFSPTLCKFLWLL